MAIEYWSYAILWEWHLDGTWGIPMALLPALQRLGNAVRRAVHPRRRWVENAAVFENALCTSNLYNLIYTYIELIVVFWYFWMGRTLCFFSPLNFDTNPCYLALTAGDFNCHEMSPTLLLSLEKGWLTFPSHLLNIGFKVSYTFTTCRRQNQAELLVMN